MDFKIHRPCLNSLRPATGRGSCFSRLQLYRSSWTSWGLTMSIYRPKAASKRETFWRRMKLWRNSWKMLGEISNSTVTPWPKLSSPAITKWPLLNLTWQSLQPAWTMSVRVVRHWLQSSIQFAPAWLELCRRLSVAWQLSQTRKEPFSGRRRNTSVLKTNSQVSIV